MAKTTTSYFNSNKFDLTEWTALISLWMTFMIDSLTRRVRWTYDWVKNQVIIQMGDLHEPNRTYPSPEVDDTEQMTPTIDPDPQPITTVNPDPDPQPEPVTLTYKDLQRMLKEYRDNRGDIQCKLNAKREILESEVKRLGLIA